MISAWTKHLKDQDEQARFKNNILSSRDVFERMGELLEEMKEDAQSPKRAYVDYDKPNWAYKQADINGYLRCIDQIKTLIDLNND